MPFPFVPAHFLCTMYYNVINPTKKQQTQTTNTNNNQETTTFIPLMANFPLFERFATEVNALEHLAQLLQEALPGEDDPYCRLDYLWQFGEVHKIIDMCINDLMTFNYPNSSILKKKSVRGF